MEQKTPPRIKIRVMDHTGDSTVEVGFDDALGLIKAEMGKGKWLRVATNDGKNYIVFQLEVLTKDLESITADILNSKSITLMAALAGGSCGDPVFGSCIADSSGSVKAGPVGAAAVNNTFRFDMEGYDAAGFNVDGYDRDGFDESGFDADGYDRDGFNAEGFDENGFDRNGEPKAQPKTGFPIKVVSDKESPSLICVTADAVVFNNAYGREVFAAAAARLLLAINVAVPELMSGKAVVTIPGK